MKDIDVRMAVHAKILKDHHKDPNTMIVDEFCINLGSVRADITVINGILHGYELKSSSDTLDRLPTQVKYYSYVMDKATLVVAENHVADAIELLPHWWGIKVVSKGKRGAMHLASLRSSKRNPCVNSLALAQLLWKEECLFILEKMGLAKGNKSKPRYELWNVVASNAPLEFLKDEVRTLLKKRTGWRV